MGHNRISLNVNGVNANELDSLQKKLDDNNIKYEVFKSTLNIVLPDKDILNIKNQGSNSVDNRVVFTYNRFKEGKDSFLIEQKSNESNKTFVEKVANETGIPSFIISKLFQYNEQRNQLAELTKVANSLRKLSPKFVRVTTSKVVDPESGQTGSTTSFAFINKVNDYKSSSSMSSTIRGRLDILPFRRQIVNKIEQYKALNAKSNIDKSVYRNLLHDILVSKTGFDILSEDDFSRIDSNNVIILLNNFERILDHVADIYSNKPSEEFKESDAYLRHTSNLGNAITKYTFEKNNPTSFSVSTSNKSKWENVMPNSSWKLFKNLEDYATKIGKSVQTKLFPFFKNSFKNYLTK